MTFCLIALRQIILSSLFIVRYYLGILLALYIENKKCLLCVDSLAIFELCYLSTLQSIRAIMIVIYGIKANLNPIKLQLSNVIHGCMQSVLGMPEDKRAQRFIALDAEDFYYPADRSAAYTVIEINIMQGRSVKTKKALIQLLFQRIEEQLNIVPIDIEITIKEQPAHCWGFRGMTGDEAHDLTYKVQV